MKKLCIRCGEDKLLTEYHKHPATSDGREGRCKTCRVDAARENARDRKLEAIQMNGGKCLDCEGTFHPAVYEFHHLDPAEKIDSPSNLLWKSKKLYFTEIAKCVMLCANCHRLRHFGEGDIS